MTFWLLTGAMTVLVAVLLGLALLRARGEAAAETAAYDLQVYRDQLKEVDRDLARGALSEEDAERVRTEIGRRILQSDAQAKEQAAEVRQPAGLTRIATALATLALVGGSALIYLQIGAPGYGDLALSTRIEAAEHARLTRPDQSQAEAGVTAPPPRAAPNAEFAALMARLREMLPARPDDLRGHELLARNEAILGNFAAAYAAQERVLQIKGDAADAQDWADYAEMMILAAGGYVSPQAEAALREATERDPNNRPALYYLGLMLAQTGRPDQAFIVWEGLLRAGPPDAPWIPPIRAQIEEIAFRAGVVNFTLPPLEQATPRGPSQADLEAAEDMDAETRAAMIQGMVEGLAARLASEGGPAFDWARLISALGVLGETERAITIYNEALERFEGDAEAIEMIRNGARQGQLIP